MAKFLMMVSAIIGHLTGKWRKEEREKKTQESLDIFQKLARDFAEPFAAVFNNTPEFLIAKGWRIHKLSPVSPKDSLVRNLIPCPSRRLKERELYTLAMYCGCVYGVDAALRLIAAINNNGPVEGLPKDCRVVFSGSVLDVNGRRGLLCVDSAGRPSIQWLDTISGAHDMLASELEMKTLTYR